MEADQSLTVPKVLTRLAQMMGTAVKNHRLEIPEKFGVGYCAGFVFNAHIRLLLLNYELKEDLLVDNPEADAAAKMVLFKFQNVLPGPDAGSTGQAIPSVLIATGSLNANAVIPIHSNTAMINVEVNAPYLKGLVGSSGKSPVVQSLLENTQPLLFEELIFPALQTIVNELVNEPVDEPFELFFRRVKTEELICRLLMALEKREERQLYALNSHDLAAIYTVREQLLERLETPPVINDLALRAHMSPTKLKRLFRQIFGNSIFSYYQDFRMKEAARLLKEEKLAVSEVGYRLGFTNLSHFSKVFYEHIGTKPKQYSRTN